MTSLTKLILALYSSYKFLRSHFHFTPFMTSNGTDKTWFQVSDFPQQAICQKPSPTTPCTVSFSLKSNSLRPGIININYSKLDRVSMQERFNVSFTIPLSCLQVSFGPIRCNRFSKLFAAPLLMQNYFRNIVPSYLQKIGAPFFKPNMDVSFRDQKIKPYKLWSCSSLLLPVRRAHTTFFWQEMPVLLLCT